MKRDHFPNDEWVDYVRTTLSPDQHRAITDHLGTGCLVCTQVHDMWRAVFKAADAERRYEPPADTLRLVRAQFAGQKPAGSFGRVVEHARLLFDSHLAAAPVGLRTARPGPRQLVYASGDFLIDVQVRPAGARGETLMIGQISSAKHPYRADGSRVVLERDTQVIARTTTNRLGEFQIQFDGPVADLSLTFAFEVGGAVVKLGNLTRMES